jgi:hypothetical protein
MPQRLLLGDGREHIVGQPVEEDPAPEQAVEDAHAALEEGTAEAPEPDIIAAVTAFTVYLMRDGDVLLGFDPWANPQPERPATFDEMTHGAAVVRWHVSQYSWQEPGADTTEGCVTAFTPYLLADGRWQLSAKPDDPLVVERAPANDEIFGGLAVVERDLQTQEILGPLFNQFAQSMVNSITLSVVQGVIGNMMNLGKQAADAKEALDIAKELEKDKMRRGGGGKRSGG